MREEEYKRNEEVSRQEFMQRMEQERLKAEKESMQRSAKPPMPQSQPKVSQQENEGNSQFGMVSTKNYSKDSNTLGWQQKGAGPMSSVALQAQGFQLPQQARAPIQPYPVGLSHTQDPRFMNQTYGKNEQIRLEKEKRSHVGGQKAVEDNF